MAETKYKYNLNHFFSLMPRSIKLEDLEQLLEQHGISARTFRRDRYIVAGADESISADRLIVYSKVFECSMEQLINESKKIKSIREIAGKKLKIDTGLHTIVFIVLCATWSSCASYTGLGKCSSLPSTPISR